jgi:hypothetical protein
VGTLTSSAQCRLSVVIRMKRRSWPCLWLSFSPVINPRFLRNKIIWDGTRVPTSVNDQSGVVKWCSANHTPLLPLLGLQFEDTHPLFILIRLVSFSSLAPWAWSWTLCPTQASVKSSLVQSMMICPKFSHHLPPPFHVVHFSTHRHTHTDTPDASRRVSQARLGPTPSQTRSGSM